MLIKHTIRPIFLLLLVFFVNYVIASQSTNSNVQTASKSTVKDEKNKIDNTKRLPNLPDKPPKDEAEVPEEIVDLYSDPSLSVAEKWELIGQFYNDFAWPHRLKIIEYLERAVNEPKLKFNPKCEQSLKLLRTGLNESTLWSFEMMDSMAKMRPGFLSGEYGDFGKWDECIEINYDEKQMKFKGEYCMYELHWPQPENDAEHKELLDHFKGGWMEDLISHHHLFRLVPVTNGLCFPSVCTKQELTTAIQFYLDEADIPIEFKFHKHSDTADRYLETYSDQPLWKRACGYGLMTLFGLVVLSTWLSYYHPELCPTFLESFDATRNTLTIFEDYDNDKEKERWSFVFGETVWHLLALYPLHVCFMAGLNAPQTHFTLFNFNTEDLNPFLGNFFAWAHLHINTAFVATAMMSYIAWHAAGASLNPINFVLRKVQRVWPPLIGALVILMAFPHNFGSGPLFMQGYSNVTGNCQENWWKELLFLSNTNQANESCLIHSWTLSADMQLYVASFVIYVLLKIAPTAGVMACLAAAIGGVMLQTRHIHDHNLGLPWNLDSIRIYETFETLQARQFATVNYISSYAIGLLLGFILMNKVKLRAASIMIVSPFVAAMVAWIVYNGVITRGANFDPSLIPLMASLMSLAMAVLAAWVFYLMYWDKLPMVTAVFKSYPMVYLGRLQQSTYMMHYLFIWYNNFSMRQPIEYRCFPLMMRFISDVTIGHTLGYLAYLVFEGPARSIVRRTFGYTKPIRTAQDVNDNVKKSN